MIHKRNGSTSYTIPKGKSLDIGSFSKYISNTRQAKPSHTPKKVQNTSIGMNITTHTVNSFTKINGTAGGTITGYKSKPTKPKSYILKPRNPRQISLNKNPIKISDKSIHNTLDNPNITALPSTIVTIEAKAVKTEACAMRSNNSIPNDTDRKSFARFLDNNDELNFVNVLNDEDPSMDESIQEICPKPDSKKTDNNKPDISICSSKISESLIYSDKLSISRYGTNNLFNNRILSIRSTPYDMSNRFVNDEKGNCNLLFFNNSLKMMNNIKEEVKYKIFNSKKFLQLPDNAMYNILSYAFPVYDKICQSKLIRKKLYLTLNSEFNQCISTFRSLYSEVLDLQEYYFKPTYINRNINNQGKSLNNS
jgi:hypothetical protein